MSCRTLSLFLAVALFSTAGCGDDDTNPNNMGDPIDSLFALGLRIRLADGTTTSSFLRTFESLDGLSDVQIDDQAQEFVGQQRFRRIDGGMFLENADAPEITRYDFDRNQGLVRGDTLSFANLGFSISGSTVVVSSTKAYNINFADLRIAIFNPTEMILQSQTTIDLPSDELTQGFTTNGIATAQVGNLLYISVAFANLSSPAIDPGITVYIVNTATDSLVNVIVDSRCSHVNGTIQTDNDDIYLLGDNGFNVINQAQACIVRIKAGETEFDVDYILQPSGLLGGRQTSELIALDGTRAVTFPLYPEELNPNDPTSIAFDPVRKPWLIDLATATATASEFVGAPFTRGTPSYRINGELWLGTSSSFEETTVYALDPDQSTATVQFKTEGQLLSLLEIL